MCKGEKKSLQNQVNELEFKLLKSQQSNADLCESGKAKDKWINELLKKVEELELEILL